VIVNNLKHLSLKNRAPDQACLSADRSGEWCIRFIAMIMNKDKNMECEYCRPMRSSHFDDKVSSVINHLMVDRVFLLAKKVLPLNGLNSGIHKVFNYWSEEIEVPREKMFRRSLVIYDEAVRRGLDVCFLNSYLFKLKVNNKEIYFKQNPISESCIDSGDFDRKDLFRKFLNKNKFKCAEGKVFWSKVMAFRYGKKLGFPLVVKPSDSSNSRHVSIRIENESELKRAIQVAKQISHKVIVEKYIEGDVFRVLFLGGKVIGVLRRVAGDGQEKINVGLGGEVYNCIDEMDKICKSELEKVSRKIKNEMFAFDIIAKNIKSGDYKIIEYNSLPYIDLHHFPTTGKVVNVAGLVLDYLQKEGIVCSI